MLGIFFRLYPPFKGVNRQSGTIQLGVRKDCVHKLTQHPVQGFVCLIFLWLFQTHRCVGKNGAADEAPRAAADLFLFYFLLVASWFLVRPGAPFGASIVPTTILVVTRTQKSSQTSPSVPNATKEPLTLLRSSHPAANLFVERFNRPVMTVFPNVGPLRSKRTDSFRPRDRNARFFRRIRSQGIRARK